MGMMVMTAGRAATSRRLLRALCRAIRMRHESTIESKGGL